MISIDIITCAVEGVTRNRTHCSCRDDEGETIFVSSTSHGVTEEPDFLGWRRCGNSP